MEQHLYELLRQCTVRVSIPGKDGHGTGFFVAPGLVLTCAHVVKAARPNTSSVEVYWNDQSHPALISTCLPDQDLAVLQVNLSEHPCVFLDEETPRSRDPLHSYGYSDNYPEGDTLTAEYEGWTHDTQPLLKFKEGQVRPGLSGAPLLNERTGMVCGIILRSRDRESNLGGRAGPVATVLKAFPELVTQQQQFHHQDQRWTKCLQQEAALATSVAGRPTTYLPFLRDPLFQPRPSEFEQLETLLFGSGPNQQPARLGLVGVIGMGGVGKTHLAVEFAYRYQHRFPAGIFWMPATGNSIFEWQHQFAELAFNAGYFPPDDDVSHPENERRRARHFCRYLADHANTLLILDNVEDPDLIISALPALAGGDIAYSVLYTSRSTLTPRGTVAYPVAQLPEEGALRLLLQTTRPALLTEVLVGSQDGEAQGARFICQGVGSLPLAIVHLRGLLARDKRLTLVSLAEVLKQRGAMELAKAQRGDTPALFATFSLSWEKVQQEKAQRLFKLASYFPEAIPIPLWLLGLAAGLGERGDFFEPLGEALLHLQEVSLIEELSGDQIRLHPLVCEFGRRLVAEEGQEGTALLEAAAERLAIVLTDLKVLESRARREGYWVCLEQVRAACAYAAMLGTDKADWLERIEYWMDRESYLLGNEKLWPERVPGLFYQQLFNRSIENGTPFVEREISDIWLRQSGQVNVEDRLQLRVFAGHTSWVSCVAFSPDGHMLLTGSFDRTVQLRETASGKSLLTWQGHTAAVTCVAFSPDGRIVFTGSSDRQGNLWEATTGKLLTALQASEEIQGITFSSTDESFVPMNSPDWEIPLQEIEEGWGVNYWSDYSSDGKNRLAPLEYAAFLPDGNSILTGFSDGTLYLWESASGKLLTRWQGHRGKIQSIAFSSDGHRALTSSEGDMAARVWDIMNRKLLTTLRHTSCVSIAVFSSDGQTVLSGTTDGLVELWEATSGKLLSSLLIAKEEKCMAFSPNRAYVITDSYHGMMHVWEIATGKSVATLLGYSGYVRDIVFSPDVRTILVGLSDGTARLWKITSENGSTELPEHRKLAANEIRSWVEHKGPTDKRMQHAYPSEATIGGSLAISPGHANTIQDMEFSPDGRTILTVSEDQTARLWNVASVRLLTTLPGHTQGVRSVAFSPDGHLALTGSVDQTARLWDISHGKLLITLQEHGGSVDSVAFSPDGLMMLTGASDTIVRLWEVKSGKLLNSLHGHTGIILSTSFSPDGRLILTGSPDMTARLWETASGKLLSTWEGYRDTVLSLAFSPDGCMVLTGSTFGVVQIWEAVSGKVLAELHEHLGSVGEVVFSPDGCLGITCDKHGKVLLWRTTKPDIGKLVDVYMASYEIGAIFWQDATHIILADKGGAQHYPHFYRLILEGY